MRPDPRARSAYADAVAAQGPAWANCAASIRSGFTNNWIAAGIAALDAMLRLVPDEDEDDQDERFPSAHRAQGGGQA